MIPLPLDQYTQTSPINDYSYDRHPSPLIYFDEVWLPVKENVAKNICPYYWVSNYGRIYSECSKKLLRLCKDHEGYLQVCFHLTKPMSSGLYQCNKRVNRIVMLTFCPIENADNLVVNHLDGIKFNNHISNLEWCTYAENAQHAIRTGLTVPDVDGEKNPMAKLSEKEVFEIAELLKTRKYTHKEIAQMYSVRGSAICAISNKTGWTHLDLDVHPYRVRKSNFDGKRAIYDLNPPKRHNNPNQFTESEMHAICKYFESVDINDFSKYRTNGILFDECFRVLDLYKKYPTVEGKRKTLEKLLYKSCPGHDYITTQYNYECER